MIQNPLKFESNISTIIINNNRLYASNGTTLESSMKINTIIEKSYAITSTSLNPLQNKLILLIGANKQAYIYPNTSVALLQASVMFPKLTICNVDKYTGILTGYRVHAKTLKVAEVWKMDFSQTGEEIANYASADQLNKDEYQGMEENNGNIIYKYVNPNLMAVATFSGINHLNLYIINRSNGSIIYAGHVYNVDKKHEVKVVFQENTIVVTYLKKYVNYIILIFN